MASIGWPGSLSTETFTAETLPALPMSPAAAGPSRPIGPLGWSMQRVAGRRIYAADYLVDEQQRRPGGGGLLIFEAETYAEALVWVRQRPDDPSPAW